MNAAPAARLALALALTASCVVGPARADEPPRPEDEGLFVTVPNPVSAGGLTTIKGLVERARANRDRPVRTVVFDFNPDNKDAATPDFGPCLDLAEYIKRDLADLATVAFVHGRVTRHTVLPVLACKERALSKESALGDVNTDARDGPLADYKVGIYQSMVPANQAGLVAKLLERNVEVVRGRDAKDNSVWFIDARREAEAAARGVTVDQPRTPLPPGTLLSAEQCREYGLCRVVLEYGTRLEVRELFNLSPSSLREDPLRGRTPKAWKVDLRGPVTPALEESLKRRVKSVIARRANTIVFQIECSGGDPNVAIRLAEFVRTLRDDEWQEPVLTIAFLPDKTASDVSTFLAFGCTEIVMGKDAVLGNFDTLFRPGRRGEPPPPVGPLADALADLAEKQGYPPLVARRMLDPTLDVHRVRGTGKFANVRRVITEKELAEEAPNGAPRWIDEGRVGTPGQPLKLDAELAKQLGVARHVVQNVNRPDEVYAAYNLESTRVQELGPDWLDAFAAFLRQPGVTVLLVLIGIAGLILELKMPGTAVPGITAALCFVLFFWSQSQMSGQIFYLALLLFVLGLVLLLVEIFVLPGFGVTGVSGILLVMAGLGLATVERFPQTSEEWYGLGSTLMAFGFSMVGGFVVAGLFVRYLPSIPYLNRLVLMPPGEDPDGDGDAPALPGVEEAAALLGVIGTAATPLRPAGMVRFGERYVDVVTEGGFVPTGARVQVIEVEGNRVVVKEV